MTNLRILQSYDGALPSSFFSFWNKYCCLEKVAIVLGTFILIKLIWRFIYNLYDLFLAGFGVDLAKKYGKGSYVVITGTTAGIGRSLATDFARLGFNIVQISRNPTKLKKVEDELKREFPSLKIVTIVSDLSKCYEPNFSSNIAEKVEGLDISILVNNAGIDYISLFYEMSDELIKNTLLINVNSLTMITKIFINKLKKRKTSAVICLGSFAGTMPMAYFGLYSATKAFVATFVASMNKEFPTVDFMNVTPSEVCTQMTCYKTDVFTIQAKECTQSILKELSRGKKSTTGHWNHKIQEFLYLAVPEKLYDIVWAKFIVADFCKSRGLAPPTPIS